MSNGWIKQVKYFPKQLDGNYLKSITIWYMDHNQ
jgi:hypothetical protein